MEATGSIGMNAGEGKNSYAKNSDFQALVQQMLMPLLEAAAADLCRADVPSRVTIADLGCSSGPNALALISNAAKALRRHRRTADDDVGGGGGGELCVYLNDLPGNDFNTVFKAVPVHFPPEQDGKAQPSTPAPLIFVFGAPGSFYGRLFPTGTLNLACSSCSLHWLSKVPEELQSRKLVNKRNICAGRTSPPEVISAYARQFKSDFTSFLESRAEETVPGGWLVLSIKGRSHKNMADTEDCRCWDDMATVLHNMASRGVIDEEKVESFQLRVYEPCLEEVREAVEAEGSFEIVCLESGVIVESKDAAGVARGMRAMHEASMLRHFGEEAGIMEEFVRTAEGFVEELRLSGGFPFKLVVHVASLRRKI